MSKFLLKQWFLRGLVACISCGLFLGTCLTSSESAAPGPSVAAASTFQAIALKLQDFQTRGIVAFIMLLMAFSLDSQQLRASFQTPLPVLWAGLVNFAFIPVFGWCLSHLQMTQDYVYGLMIAASVPCTLAAASVWTRKARGNDAVSLLVTLTTNAACFVVTPFWLTLATRNQDVELELSDMIWRLVGTVLVPTLVGQGLRCVPRLARFATEHKTQIGVLAQSCVLVVVFVGATNAGVHLVGNSAGAGIASTALVWISCIVMHLTAMCVGLTGARLFGFSRPDRTAIAFASSQKTLPIGLDIAVAYFSVVPFAVFPMLMYHASQLFIDTAIAGVFARRVETDPDRGSDC